MLIVLEMAAAVLIALCLVVVTLTMWPSRPAPRTSSRARTGGASYDAPVRAHETVRR